MANDVGRLVTLDSIATQRDGEGATLVTLRMQVRARQLQGQCLVESGPGLGTVVRLSIPVNRPDDPA